jgi:hypothetical protein
VKTRHRITRRRFNWAAGRGSRAERAITVSAAVNSNGTGGVLVLRDCTQSGGNSQMARAIAEISGFLEYPGRTEDLLSRSEESARILEAHVNQK